MEFGLLMLLCVIALSIRLAFKEYREEQREDEFFLADKLSGKTWLVSVTDTTKESITNGRFDFRRLQ